MVELENLTLGRSTLLALFLGALVGIDWSSRGSLLRADTAAIVIPIQLAVWVGCSSLVLRCGVRRAVQLLAFVLFAGALVTFSTGAVLVMA